MDYAEVYGNAIVSDNAQILEKAEVWGDAYIYENASVEGEGYVYDKAKIYGNTMITENASVFENAEVYGNSDVLGTAQVYGNASVSSSMLSKDVEVCGNSFIESDMLDKGIISNDDKNVKLQIDYKDKISYDRMSELATKFKDRILELEDDYDYALEYLRDECDMSDYELNYFGIEADDYISYEDMNAIAGNEFDFNTLNKPKSI